MPKRFWRNAQDSADSFAGTPACGNWADGDMDAFRRAGPDLILHLASGELPGELLKGVKRGAWSLRHGQHAAMPGDAARRLGIPSRQACQQQRRRRAGRVVVLQAHALRVIRGDRSEVGSSQPEQLLLKSAGFIARMLKKLIAAPPVQWPPPQSPTYRPRSGPSPNIPGNTAVCRALAGRMLRQWADNLRYTVVHDHWFIAWQLQQHVGTPNTGFRDFHRLQSPKIAIGPTRFPCAWTASITCSSKSSYMPPAKARSLSANCCRRARGASRRSCWNSLTIFVSLYLLLAGTVVHDPRVERQSQRQLVAVCRIPGPLGTRYGALRRRESLRLDRGRDRRPLWMFSCIAAEGARAYDELFLFHAAVPRGPWTPHRLNPVLSDARFARPAGKPFLNGTRWLRPPRIARERTAGE